MTSLGLTTDPRTTAEPADLFAAVAAAGFTHVGVPASFAQASPLLAQHGLACDEVLAVMFSGDTKDVLASARRAADAASELGARNVLGFVTSTCADTAYQMREVVATLASSGVRLALEFSPVSALPSLATARDLVASSGVTGRVGFVLDPWHVFNGPTTLADVSAVPIEEIAYVQFDDGFPVAEDAWAETMNGRVWPGEGSFDLGGFVDAVRGRGWDGLVSVEVLNVDYGRLPLAEFAQRAFDTTQKWWN